MILSVTAAIGEIAYLMLQAARGVHSHFNVATAWEASAFTAMGIGAVILTGTSAVLALALLRFSRDGFSGVFRLAVILGLGITFVAGTYSGFAIAENGGRWVGGLGSDADGLAVMGWARDGGDLRVGHFFGLHALQVLPIAGLLAAGLSWRAGMVAVPLVAAGYAALALGTTFQAQAGLPFLPWLG